MQFALAFNYVKKSQIFVTCYMNQLKAVRVNILNNCLDPEESRQSHGLPSGLVFLSKDVVE
jgi:hypothetical protein